MIGPELSLLKAGFGLACFLGDASSTMEGAQVRGTLALEKDCGEHRV